MLFTENPKLSSKEISLNLVKRLLGCLGNINEIKDPVIHRRVLEFIHSKWELLAKVSELVNYSQTYFFGLIKKALWSP